MGSSFSTSTVFKGVDRMSPVFDKMSKKTSSFGSTLKAVLSANVITAGFNRLVSGVTDGIEAFTSFETAMAKVSTIADTNAMSMEAQTKAIMKLSNQTGQAVSTLAEAQYQAISAGIATADSVSFVGTASKAAIGGFTDTTTAVDGLTTILNAYALEAKDATIISDQLINTQNFGKTTFGEMAQSLGNVVPVAASLKVETFELFGAIATLTKQGIKTPMAMTQIKAALSNILKPTETAAKLSKELGLEFSSTALQSKGLAGFLDDVMDKTGGSQDMIAQLFGSTEALGAVMALTAEDGKILTQALDVVKNTTGSTDASFAKMTDTFGFRWQAVKNRFTNVSIGIMDSMSPLLDMLLDITEKIDFDKVSAGLSNFIGGLDLENMASKMIEFVDKAISKIPEIVSQMALMAPEIKGFAADIGDLVRYLAIGVSEIAKLTSGPIFGFLKWTAENNIISNMGKSDDHFSNGGSLDEWLNKESPNQSEANGSTANFNQTINATSGVDIDSSTSVNGAPAINKSHLMASGL